MQAVAGVVQQVFDLATKKVEQAQAKLAADLLGTGALLTGLQFVMLGNVVALQALKGGHAARQAGRRHAPSTYGGAHQVHGLGALGQPLAKNKAVQRPQDQTLGTTGRARHGGNVVGRQAMGLDVGQGFGACV